MCQLARDGDPEFKNKLYAFPITTNPVICRCYNKKLATEIILEGDSYLTRVRAYASLNNLGSRRLYLKCKRECQSNFICEDPHFILPHSSPKGGRCTFFLLCSNVFMYVSTGYISSFRDGIQLYSKIRLFSSCLLPFISCLDVDSCQRRATLAGCRDNPGNHFLFLYFFCSVNSYFCLYSKYFFD